MPLYDILSCQKDCIHESIILLIILLLPYCIASHFMFSYMTILDYFHIPGNVPKLDKWKIKTMMMMMMMMMMMANINTLFEGKR